jgi:hypothetical protein
MFIPLYTERSEWEHCVPCRKSTRTIDEEEREKTKRKMLKNEFGF